MYANPVALVISADRLLRRLVAVSLDQIGCLSLDVATSRQGLECVGTTHVDFVIVDVSLTDAFEDVLVRRLRLEEPELKVLYLVGGPCPVSSGPIVRNIDAYLRKPFRLHELRAVVSSWLNGRCITSPGSSISLN